MLARGSGGGKGEALYDREERIKAVHGKHAAEHVVAQHDLSPSVSPSMDSASFYSSRCGFFHDGLQPLQPKCQSRGMPVLIVQRGPLPIHHKQGLSQTIPVSCMA